jgi:Holliday junction resolvase RusA-like endonuclease
MTNRHYEKILSDCITKAGIWKDDSQIDDGRVIRLPVSKADPHCEVSIEAL